MRKITIKSVAAFKAGIPFKEGNTRVEVTASSIDLFLHDNLIAYRNTGDELIVNHAGWRTNTTKERLNGVLLAYKLPTIYQRNFEWYFTDGVQFNEKNLRKFNIKG